MLILLEDGGGGGGGGERQKIRELEIVIEITIQQFLLIDDRGSKGRMIPFD